jgi:hypothetical protein
MVQIRKSRQDGKSSIVWKNLAVVAFGVFVLVTMNLILVHSSSSSGDKTKATSAAGKFIQESSEISQEIGSGAEQKEEPSSKIATMPIEPSKDADAAASSASSSRPKDAVPTSPGSDSAGGTPAAAVESVPAATPVETAPIIIPDHHDDEQQQRHTYTRRGQPMSDADRQSMSSKWGSWTLIDTKERPQHDFYKEYPNRDVPRDKFPSNAWQIDKEYLAKFLPESLALVERAQEAILAEYGKTEGTFEERSKMFYVEHISREELETATGLVADSGRRGNKEGRPCTYQGGCTTPTGWEGLKRQMLHAVMTEDNFVFAMGGHSASAGHGYVLLFLLFVVHHCGNICLAIFLLSELVHSHVFIVVFAYNIVLFSSTPTTTKQQPLSAIVHTPGSMDFRGRLCEDGSSTPSPELWQRRIGNHP